MSEEKDQDQMEAPDPETGKTLTRRELLQRLSPLGKVALDSSRCTGCGLCAVECPTEALVFSLCKDDDTFQLVFRHGSCLACGQCAVICPEKCLAVERILGLDNIGSQSVLFQDRLLRCSKCGQPLGPKSMIDRMRARVAAAGKTFPFQFELCPDCKVRSQLSQLRM
jgi:ferredoxin